MRSWMSLALLVLVALGVPAHSAECPAEEDISPCTCDDLDEDFSIILSCYGDISQTDLKRSFNAVKGIDNIGVELDEINLGTIPSNFFEGLRIKKLSISHCELVSLTDGSGPALRGLEDGLEELEIMASFSEDNGPVKLDLSHMRRLAEVDLSFNGLTEVGNDWFERGPASLTTLMLSNNAIEKLGDRAFANLANLKVLHLHGSRFGPIKRSMFPSSAQQLTDIELDNNDLTSIPDDFFSNMPALRYISLRTNVITHLPQSTWESVWQRMDTIRLEGNPLVCDSHIDWMRRVTSSAAVFGRCNSPPDMDGKDLYDVIKGRL
ncbi:Protein slit, partial [Stegodyphus mimosarum]